MQINRKTSPIFWYTLLVFGMFCWSLMIPLTKILTDDLSSISISFLRYSIAFIFMLVLSKKLVISLKLSRKDIIPVAFLGIISTTFTTFLIALGVKNSTVIHSAIIVNTNPLIVALFAPLLIQEKTTLKKILGVIVGFLGVVIVVLNGGSVSSLFKSTFLFGIAILLSASLCQAVYALFIKKYLKKYSGKQLAFMSFLFGFLAILPFMFFESRFQELLSLHPTSWFIALTIGTISTAVPIVLFTSGIKYIGASTASSFKLTIPVFATIIALLFFNESITLFISIGIMLVLGGIFLVTYNKKQKKSLQDS